MTIDKIEEIIYAEVEGSDGSYPKNVTPAAKEIYKLHLEDKIKFYKEIESYWIDDNMDEMPNYTFYLKQELKTLENES